MRLRGVARQPKDIVSDTGWREGDVAPRFAPVYPKTRPMRGDWRWRSARLTDGQDDYVLFVQCNPRRGNWKAWLMKVLEGSASIVARLEEHRTHPGLHLHAHCERGAVEVGTSSIDDLQRIPPNDAHHRRKQAFTETTFWRTALSVFRVRNPDRQGTLL